MISEEKKIRIKKQHANDRFSTVRYLAACFHVSERDIEALLSLPDSLTLPPDKLREINEERAR